MKTPWLRWFVLSILASGLCIWGLVWVTMMGWGLASYLLGLASTGALYTFVMVVIGYAIERRRLE